MRAPFSDCLSNSVNGVVQGGKREKTPKNLKKNGEYAK